MTLSHTGDTGTRSFSPFSFLFRLFKLVLVRCEKKNHKLSPVLLSVLTFTPDLLFNEYQCPHGSNQPKNTTKRPIPSPRPLLSPLELRRELRTNQAVFILSRIYFAAKSHGLVKFFIYYSFKTSYSNLSVYTLDLRYLQDKT